MRDKLDRKNLKQIGKGRTAEVFELDESRVLKLFKKNTYEPRKNREYEILKSIRVENNSILSVPEVFQFYEEEDRKGFCMEKMTGISLDQKYRVNLGKKCRILAELSYLVSKEVHIEGEYLFKDFIRPVVMESDKIPEKVKNYLLDTLDQLPDGNDTCHGDFHGSNILVRDQGYCIIDWSEAGKCDYHADIAKQLTMYQQHPYKVFESVPYMEASFVKRLEHSLNGYACSKILREYETFRKLDRDLLQHWQMILDTMLLAQDPNDQRTVNALHAIRVSYEYFTGKAWGIT